MSKRTRIKTDALPVPATREEAEALLAEIGELDREVTRIEAAMNDELAVVKAAYEEQASPINQQIEAKFAALHAWAEANRETILKRGSKTAKLGTGELSWRMTPPKVAIRGAETVLDKLRQLGLSEFIRSKDEVNKDAILADEASRAKASAVAGITISQREEFVAKPFASSIERSEPTLSKAA